MMREKMPVEDQVENIGFNSIGGIKLVGQWWISHETPEAIVIVTHGLGEHIGRYDNFAKKFTDNKISVFGYDLRGHGNSSGKRGHARSFEELIVDLQQAMMQARLVYNDLPLYLFGHSMGGNIVANYLLRIKSKEVSGAIVSSPWFDLVMNVSSGKLKMGRLINSVWPSFTMNNNINPEDLSHITSIVEQYREDPLVHDRISARLYFSNVEAGRFANNHADRLSIPVLICHGTEDQITSISASQQFAAKSGKLAEFHTWEGAKHEPHHDLQQEEVLKYYVDWIKDLNPNRQ